MEKDKASDILVSYKARSLIFPLPASLSEFLNETYARFSIDPSAAILIQYYNENWADYIDVTRDEEIYPGAKYKITLDIPEILYVERSNCDPDKVDSHLSVSWTPATHSQALHTPACSATSEASSNRSCESPGSSQSLAMSTTRSSSVPDNFTIPVQEFSSRLHQALRDQLTLSRILRSELIHVICSSLMTYSKYPTSIMVIDMARAIISNYPYLKESVGTGYGGWRQAIRDKLKNMRRFDQSEEVKERKKVHRIASKGKTEDDDNKKYQGSKQKKHPHVDLKQGNALCQVNAIFDARRNEIVNQNMKVDALKVKYPSLFSKLEFENEFFRITGKSNLFEFIPKFLQTFSKQLYHLLMARKKLPSWVESVKCVQDESGTNMEIAMESLILITLPVHFSEDQLALTYPATTTSDDIKNVGSTSPHLGIIGLETNHPKYYILAEHEIIIMCDTLPEAMATLIASYYILNCEYPKQWKKTLLFIQTMIFDIESDVTKLPSKVVNFVEKVKSFSP